MPAPKKQNRYNGGRQQTNKIADAMDDLAEFESFKADILPKLRQMIKAGKSADEIYKFAQSMAAGRVVSMAINSPDEKVVLASVREILDRSVGKASDKLEITTKYGKLTELELDALIKSQEEEIGDEELPRH